jgi:hypothetical protein
MNGVNRADIPHSIPYQIDGASRGRNLPVRTYRQHTHLQLRTAASARLIARARTRTSTASGVAESRGRLTLRANHWTTRAIEASGASRALVLIATRLLRDSAAYNNTHPIMSSGGSFYCVREEGSRM